MTHETFESLQTPPQARLRDLIQRAADSAGKADAGTVALEKLHRELTEVDKLRSQVSPSSEDEALAWATLAAHMSTLAAFPVPWEVGLALLRRIPELDPIDAQLGVVAANLPQTGLLDSFRDIALPAAFAAALAWCRYIDRWDEVLGNLSYQLRGEVENRIFQSEFRRNIQNSCPDDRAGLEEFEWDPEVEAELAGISADRPGSALPHELRICDLSDATHPVRQAIATAANEYMDEEWEERKLTDLHSFIAKLPRPIEGVEHVSSGADYALAAKFLGALCLVVGASAAVRAVSEAPELIALRRSLQIVRDNVLAGESMSMSFRCAGFPQVICDAAAWGETTGTLDKTLDQAADFLVKALRVP